jgi:hypothetical protein
MRREVGAEEEGGKGRKGGPDFHLTKSRISVRRFGSLRRSEEVGERGGRMGGSESGTRFGSSLVSEVPIESLEVSVVQSYSLRGSHDGGDAG